MGSTALEWVAFPQCKYFNDLLIRQQLRMDRMHVIRQLLNKTSIVKRDWWYIKWMYYIIKQWKKKKVCYQIGMLMDFFLKLTFDIWSWWSPKVSVIKRSSCCVPLAEKCCIKMSMPFTTPTQTQQKNIMGE